MSSYGGGESARFLSGGLTGYPVDNPRIIGVGGSDPMMTAKNRSMGLGGGRAEIPPDASSTLFMEGLPANCTCREVSCILSEYIFRPFVGYKEVRLVTKDSRHAGGEPLALCFVDFVSSAHAATAMDAPQDDISKGADTRHGFVDHLFHGLMSQGIPTFRDEQIETGERISRSLLRAIKQSKLAVVVFSENYASSSWTLNELLVILECRRTNGQIVLPVFYKVEPSDVRNQTGTFATAFAIHERVYASSMERVRRWRNALREACSLAGTNTRVVANGYEAEAVQMIVQDIKVKLGRTWPHLECVRTQPQQQHPAQQILSTGINTAYLEYNPTQPQQLHAAQQILSTSITATYLEYNPMQAQQQHPAQQILSRGINTASHPRSGQLYQHSDRSSTGTVQRRFMWSASVRSSSRRSTNLRRSRAPKALPLGPTGLTRRQPRPLPARGLGRPKT